MPVKPGRETVCSTIPNQCAASDRPTPTPNTSPRSWTTAFAVFATPDCRCSVAISRTPIVSDIPGRNVIRAASVTVSGDAFRPSRAIAAALKLATTAASGAIIGSARAVRLASCATTPTSRPTTPPAVTSRQPPPRTGATAAPARAYAASSTYHGRCSGRASISASRSSAPATVEPVDDVSREILEPRDRVEVDGFRPDAERVAALVRQRAERELHQRRRRRDLSGFQPERGSQRAEALLEIRRRVAGAMRDPGEPEQELDRRLVRRLELGTTGIVVRSTCDGVSIRRSLGPQAESPR